MKTADELWEEMKDFRITLSDFIKQVAEEVDGNPKEKWRTKPVIFNTSNRLYLGWVSTKEVDGAVHLYITEVKEDDPDVLLSKFIDGLVEGMEKNNWQDKPLVFNTDNRTNLHWLSVCYWDDEGIVSFDIGDDGE